MQRAQRRNDDLLLYGWGYLVSALGASAVLVDVQWPPLALWTLALLAGGFAASWRLRSSRISQNTVALVIAGALLAFVLVEGHALGHLIERHPVLSTLNRDELLAMTMMGMMVLRSFAIYTRGDVVFSIVFGIAMFGLLGGSQATPANVVAFVFFLFASICLASHEHYMSQREQAEVQSVGTDRTQWMVVVSGLFLVVLTMGFAATLATAGLALKVPMVPAPKPPSANRGMRWLGFGSNSFLEPDDAVTVGTGPVDLSERIIFTVEADDLQYWRMRTYEDFDGRTWRTKKPFASIPGKAGAFELGPPAEPQELKRVRQSFKLQVHSHILVGAPQPVTYDLGTRVGAGVRRLYVDDSGGARLPRIMTLPPYSEYSVVSLVPPPVGTPRNGGEPPMPDVGEEFLRVPFAAQGVVEPLARVLTKGIRTAAGRALALRYYVSKHGSYDLEAPAIPAGEDAAAYFLSQSEPTAYCDVYASALAILCRAAGVPARFAVGFLPGQYDTSLDTTVVKEQDRHAWTEVYIPGQGWTLLDPTPTSDQGQAQVAAAKETGRSSRLPGLIALFLSVLVAALLAWLLGMRRMVPMLVAIVKRSPQPTGTRGVLIELYAKALHLLGRYGLRRSASQTPLEYLAHVRASAGHVLGGWVESLAQLTGDFMDARYSTRPVPAETVDRATAIVQQGEQELRRNRRLLRKPR